MSRGRVVQNDFIYTVRKIIFKIKGNVLEFNFVQYLREFLWTFFRFVTRPGAARRDVTPGLHNLFVEHD